MLDATSAIVAAITAHLKTALPAAIAQAAGAPQGAPGEVAVAIEGWAGPDRDITYPSVVVDAPAPGDRIASAPVLVSRVDPVDASDPSFTGFYSTGTFTLPVMLEVLAQSFQQRAEVLHAIEAALSVALVDESGVLRIPAPEYHGALVAVYQDGAARFADNADGVASGEYRAIVPLVAEVENIVAMKGTRLLELQTQTQICIELAVPAPPAETRTVFEP